MIVTFFYPPTSRGFFLIVAGDDAEDGDGAAFLVVIKMDAEEKESALCRSSVTLLTMLPKGPKNEKA